MCLNINREDKKRGTTDRETGNKQFEKLKQADTFSDRISIVVRRECEGPALHL